MTTILFAFDGSDESRRALGYAQRLEPDDSVIVLGVANKLIEAPSTDLFTEPGHDPEALRRELEQVRGVMGEAGVQAEVITAIGNPADEILKTAESRGADLIVLGRRGMHRMARFLLGSVADRVVEYATCDVLVVK